MQGSFNDANISGSAAQCDVLTVEIEHVNCDALDKIVRGGSRVSFTCLHPRYRTSISKSFTSRRMPPRAWRLVLFNRLTVLVMRDQLAKHMAFHSC